jgi:small subunit ribosomal protein S6
MRKYELMMIVDPALSEADRDTLVATVESELTDHGANIVSRAHPGEQKLAYRIHASQVGYYLLYIVEKEGNFVDASNAFNLKKDIWRYMFTRVEE